MFFEDSFIYYPTREGNWDLPRSAPVPIEDVSFQAEDGVRLHGWFARGEESPWTVLWFHGNAGNLSDRGHSLVDMVSTLGINTFLIDYRGYGKSEGAPNEDGLYQDGEAAYNWLIQRGVDPKTIILMGRSLGGAIAIELATRVAVAGLIVQAAFTSIRDMIAVATPLLLPARPFVRTKFDNLSKIPQVTVPTLWIHGTEDDVVPFRMAEKLYEASGGQPKRRLWVEGADHNNLTDAYRDLWMKEMRAFLLMIE